MLVEKDIGPSVGFARGKCTGELLNINADYLAMQKLPGVLAGRETNPDDRYMKGL